MYKGKCSIPKHINEDGIFWIKPVLSPTSELYSHFRDMSRFIGEIIARCQWTSYAATNKPLVRLKKCFVRMANTSYNQLPISYSWYRGQIEKVFHQGLKAKVRMLDYGYALDFDINDIYPHRRFQDEKMDTKLEYLAIRCSLLPSGKFYYYRFYNLPRKVIDKFQIKCTVLKLYKKVK